MFLITFIISLILAVHPALKEMICINSLGMTGIFLSGVLFADWLDSLNDED